MKEKITAWLARDTYNSLSLYFEKPIKTNNSWAGGYEEYLFENQELFPQVKWEDEEPTKVKLTIEICE